MNCKEKLKILNHSIAVVVDQIEKLEVENKKLTAEKDRLAAEVARLTEAAKALGVLPDGYCFCSSDRVGDDSKIHEPECRDLRNAINGAENA